MEADCMPPDEGIKDEGIKNVLPGRNVQ